MPAVNAGPMVCYVHRTIKIANSNWYTKVGKCNHEIRIIPARAANIEVVPVRLTTGEASQSARIFATTYLLIISPLLGNIQVMVYRAS